MSVFTPTTSSVARPSAAAPLPRPSDDLRLPRYWPTWAMLTAFIFIAFECALLAAALKGRWFILLAPATVCAVKAWDAWKQLRQASDADDLR